MRAVVTRVSSASVTIGGAVNGAIGRGYLILLGVGPDDTQAVCDKLAEKICNLRVFEDENGKMNLNLEQAGGELLPTVRGQITDYILRRCGGNLAALEHFHVVGPQFLELCVKVELTVGDFNQVFGVREEVSRRLEEAWGPLEVVLTGGGSGYVLPLLRFRADDSCNARRQPAVVLRELLLCGKAGSEVRSFL